jgi:neutral ceramidase
MIKNFLSRRMLVFTVVIFMMLLTRQGLSEARITAGLAKVEITPPVGGEMWGYDGRGPSTGIHDPLFAKVLVLMTAEIKVAIVSWDVCEFQAHWLRKKVEELGIPYLLLCCTHTHGGPFLYQEDFPSKEKPLLRMVEERILGAIQEAMRNPFPAYISAGEGNIQLGYNRLHREPNRLATTYFENPERIPFGPVDPTVGVIRVKDRQDAIRAVLVHYGCHPVVLGPENRLISADYPGPMAEKVEKEAGPKAMCLFIQGCEGDVNPLFLARGPNVEENFAMVKKMGVLLADEVLKTLDSMEKSFGRSDQLLALSSNIEVSQRYEPSKKLILGVTSLLINGEIGFVTFPGEPFNLFQRELRQKAELPHLYLAGCVDNTGKDWPDYYLPDIASAAHAGYGASDSSIAGLGAGEQLMNLGLIQLYQLRGMFKDKPWRPPSWSPKKTD